MILNPNTISKYFIQSQSGLSGITTTVISVVLATQFSDFSFVILVDFAVDHHFTMCCNRADVQTDTHTHTMGHWSVCLMSSLAVDGKG